MIEKLKERDFLTEYGRKPDYYYMNIFFMFTKKNENILHKLCQNKNLRKKPIILETEKDGIPLKIA